MKCPHCEYERDTAFLFCPMCGKSSTHEEEPIAVCPTPRILNLIKDNLFLTICILLTVSTSCWLLYGGLNVIFILITIFAWLTYAGGKKNIVEHKHIRVISGSVYAIYVINNVTAIISAVCGVFYIITIFIPTLLGNITPEELFNTNKLTTEGYGLMGLIPLTTMALLWALAMVIGFVLIIVSIAILILNVAGVKKTHRLIKSIYQSAEVGEENIIGANKVGGWLIVFAVFSILSAIVWISNGNIFGFITEGCFAAVYIIFYILIGRYFKDK